jgi:hypothetical protein
MGPKVLTVYVAMKKHLGAESLELTNTDRGQNQALPYCACDLLHYAHSRLRARASGRKIYSSFQLMSPNALSYFSLLGTLLKGLPNYIEHESKEILSRGESVALASSFGHTKGRQPRQQGHFNKPHFKNVAAFLGAPIYKVAHILRSYLVESKL